MYLLWLMVVEDALSGSMTDMTKRGEFVLENSAEEAKEMTALGDNGVCQVSLTYLTVGLLLLLFNSIPPLLLLLLLLPTPTLGMVLLQLPASIVVPPIVEVDAAVPEHARTCIMVVFASAQVVVESAATTLLPLPQILLLLSLHLICLLYLSQLIHLLSTSSFNILSFHSFHTRIQQISAILHHYSHHLTSSLSILLFNHIVLTHILLHTLFYFFNGFLAIIITITIIFYFL